MKLTHEHKELHRTVVKFVEDELNPHIEEWEAAGIWPAHDVLKRMGDLGLLGVNKPTEYGGMGLDYSYELMFAMALGRCHCGSLPMAIGVQTDMATPALARFGSDELRNEYLAPAIAGEQVVSIAVSEAGAGSDVASIKTTATKDGGDYVINGSKMWITNGTQSDWACMLVNTGEGKAHKNKSLVVVPLDAKGVDRRTKLDKLGMRSSDTAMIFLDNVRVPQRNLIGQEGMGFMYQMLQFQEERLQYVHFRLAELKTEIESLKALTMQATEDYINGRDASMRASMCKLKAGRVSREVTDACLQFWGGQGFMWENRIARAYRDSRLVSIGGGADEIMLGIICKLMGTLPSRKPTSTKPADQAA